MQRKPLKSYGIALLVSLITVVIKLILDRYIGSGSPFVLLLTAILVSAWYGGLGPGLFATSLTALAGAYFFMPPFRSFVLSEPDAIRLTVFIFEGFCLSGILETRRRAIQAEQNARAEVEREVREKRGAEEAVKTELAFRRALEESMLAGVSVINNDGEQTYVNPAFCRMVGWPAEELLGRKPPYPYWLQEERERIEQTFQNTLAGQATRQGFELRLCRKSGERFEALVLPAPVRDSNGETVGWVASITDISQRVQTEIALREREARLRALFEHSQDAIGISAQGKILFVNPAYVSLLGYTSPEEMLDLPIEVTVAPSDREQMRERARRRAAGLAEPALYEYKGLKKDGTEIDLENHVSTYTLEGETYTLVTTRDVTERKRTQEALQRSEELYRTLGEAVPDFVWACGSQGQPFYVNDRWMQYIGLTLEQALQLPPDFLYHPEDFPRLVARWERLTVEVEPYEMEFRYRRYDGTYRWFLSRAVPVKDEEGHVTQWIGTTTDIHERKLAEDAVRESEFLYRSLAENLPHLVWICLPDGAVEYCNQRWYAYTGTSRVEEATDAWMSGLHPEEQEALFTLWQHCLKTGEAFEAEYRLRGAMDGTYRWHLGRSVPLRDEHGTILRWFGTTTDIDEQKRAEEIIGERVKEIERLNERLRRSIRETHHRVKNNLQVITAMLDMQAMQHTESVPVSEVARIRQHINALATIHDLLTHQAKNDPEVYALSVQAALQKLLPMLQAMLNERKIDLTVEDALLPVRQGTTLTVLVNELVSNAVKHGKGRVSVRFAREHDGCAVLEVSDEGPGFPDDFVPAQAANTGLDLIESLTNYDLSGHVTYENRPEGGGRVSLHFPLVSPVRTPGEQ